MIAARACLQDNMEHRNSPIRDQHMCTMIITIMNYDGSNRTTIALMDCSEAFDKIDFAARNSV